MDVVSYNASITFSPVIVWRVSVVTKLPVTDLTSVSRIPVKKEPCPYKLPLALILPTTVNLSLGVVVPIPTLPEEIILIASCSVPTSI